MKAYERRSVAKSPETLYTASVKLPTRPTADKVAPSRPSVRDGASPACTSVAVHGSAAAYLVYLSSADPL
ncbi:hypothetical protein EYF80_035192 [Liparis tanakae]|uniref:Uncharacterized protein n=1 Tax=Liparis tanakae TaxID=230148 RepID=A0A4Z2GN25_9TELE|nr:hypothetical protein EYF80_035192 [Liparis tanakae]